MGLIKRIFKKTPARDKKIGKIATVLGTGCATTLGVATAIGFVFPPAIFISLTVGALLLGGKAVFHAQKTEEDVQP